MINLKNYNSYTNVTEEELEIDGLPIEYSFLKFSETYPETDCKKTTVYYTEGVIGTPSVIIPQGDNKKFIKECNPIRKTGKNVLIQVNSETSIQKSGVFLKPISMLNINKHSKIKYQIIDIMNEITNKTEILKTLLHNCFNLKFVFEDLIVDIITTKKGFVEVNVLVNGIKEYSLFHDSKEYNAWFTSPKTWNSETRTFKTEWRYLLLSNESIPKTDTLINHLIKITDHENKTIKSIPTLRQST